MELFDSAGFVLNVENPERVWNDFFVKLNFKLITTDIPETRSYIITDGQVKMLLNPLKPRPYQLLINTWDLEAAREFATNKNLELEDFSDHFLISSPDGLSISVIESEVFSGLSIPTVESFTMGTFGEFATKTRNLEKNMQFWETLGFENMGIQEDPYPWAVLPNQRLRVAIGLHQRTSGPDLPVPSYFGKSQQETKSLLDDHKIMYSESEFGPGNFVIDILGEHAMYAFCW